MLCNQCFYRTDDDRCMNHCYLVGASTDIDPYGVLVSDLSSFNGCNGFRREYETKSERFRRRSLVIQDMKAFCKQNGIRYFSDFVDYCSDKNQDWYYELSTGTQVCNYMSKYFMSKHKR